MSGIDPQGRSEKRLRESVSATLDGNASEMELQRVLTGIKNDDGLRSLVGRYQLIGDAIRGQANPYANVDISQRVISVIDSDERDASDVTQPSAANDNKAVPNPKNLSAIEKSWSLLGKSAVAASVVFAVILSVRTSNHSVDVPIIAVNEPSTLTQPLQLMQTSDNGFGAASIRAGYNSKSHDSVTPEQLAYAQRIADRATHERFHAYVLQHAELAAMGHGQSVLSFARLTSFDNQ